MGPEASEQMNPGPRYDGKTTSPCNYSIKNAPWQRQQKQRARGTARVFAVVAGANFFALSSGGVGRAEQRVFLLG